MMKASEKYLNKILNGNHRMKDVEIYGELVRLETIMECESDNRTDYEWAESEYNELKKKLNIE